MIHIYHFSLILFHHLKQYLHFNQSKYYFGYQLCLIHFIHNMIFISHLFKFECYKFHHFNQNYHNPIIFEFNKINFKIGQLSTY